MVDGHGADPGKEPSHEQTAPQGHLIAVDKTRMRSARQWSAEAPCLPRQDQVEEVRKELWFIAIRVAEGQDEPRASVLEVLPCADEPVCTLQLQAIEAECHPDIERTKRPHKS